MNRYIKFSIMAFLLFLINFNVSAQRRKRKANKETKEWRYDIECQGIAKKGFKLIKVWSYSRKPQFAKEQASKNAVHGIVFKGYGGGANGCSSLKALVTDASLEKEHSKFFKVFFSDGGEYRKYVTFAGDGNIAPGDRLKISRREYKIGVVVSVAADQIRKRLEEEGIIRALDAGF